MKVTLIRTDESTGKEMLSTCETSNFIERITTETKEKHISQLRDLLHYQTTPSAGSYQHIDKLPHIFPAIEYSRTAEGERKIKNYNGIVLLDVNSLANMSETTLVKEQARMLPQTLAALTGSSGRSVKIWVSFALPENAELPRDEEKIRLFHAHAYRMAVQCYQPILSFPITLKEPSPKESFRMTLDPAPLLQLICRTFLSGAACGNARRRNLPSAQTSRKESVGTSATGI